MSAALVNASVKINPQLHRPHMVCKKTRKVLCVRVLGAICGMLEAALLWRKKFQQELEQEGFVFDPCDPGVADQQRSGSRRALLLRADDQRSSHKDPKVNNQFEEWSQANCGQRGKVVNH